MVLSQLDSFRWRGWLVGLLFVRFEGDFVSTCTIIYFNFIWLFEWNLSQSKDKHLEDVKHRQVDTKVCQVDVKTRRRQVSLNAKRLSSLKRVDLNNPPSLV